MGDGGCGCVPALTAQLLQRPARPSPARLPPLTLTLAPCPPDPAHQVIKLYFIAKLPSGLPDLDNAFCFSGEDSTLGRCVRPARLAGPAA